MSEEERAAFYQQHKDDADTWGEDDSAGADSPRRPLGATITVRLSAEDAALLRRAAKTLNVSYSDLVRKAVDAYMRPKFTIEAGTAQAELWASMMESATAAKKSSVTVTQTEPAESTTGRAEPLARSA